MQTYSNLGEKPNVTINSNYSVDSLRLRIPIKYLNPQTFRHESITPVDPVTWEAGETITKQKLRFQINYHPSYFIRLDLVKQQHGRNGELKEYILVIVNAKMLEARYFEGIKPSNYQLIYNKLMQSNYFSKEFTYQTFVKSDIYDVDIKHDYPIEIESYKRILKELKTQAKNKDSKFLEYRNQKINKPGASISLRLGNRHIGQNHLLIYYKTGEIKSQVRKAFFQAFFNTDYAPQFARSEFTIKNKTRYNQLMGTENQNLTLEALSKLDQCQYTEINRKVLKQLLNTLEKQTETKPNDKNLMYYRYSSFYSGSPEQNSKSYRNALDYIENNTVMTRFQKGTLKKEHRDAFYQSYAEYKITMQKAVQKQDKITYQLVLGIHP